MRIALLGLVACGHASSSTADAPGNADAPVIRDSGDAPIGNPIKHVVVIVKENHTFDNYFGTFPNAEGTTKALTKRGMIDCPHAPDSTPRDLDHHHSAALVDWAGGAMDGWDDVAGSTVNGDDLAYAQYHESDIPNYWAYARTFTLGDHFFANVLGPSFPGHLVVLAAQAGWAFANPDANSALPQLYWGCDNQTTTTVAVEDPQTCTTKQVFPCFKIPSVPDLLPAGVTWKFYGSNHFLPPEIWSMFDAVDSIRHGPGWANVVDIASWDTDIANHQLPSVSWLVDQDFDAEHPNSGSICSGENWTVGKINT